MKPNLFLWFLAGFCCLAETQAQAQTNAPYLKEATFTLSVDDWADISINGIPIIENQPYTSDAKGPQITTAVPKSLCYFQRENILAIEVNDKSVGVTLGQDGVGIAYILHMSFSDGRELVLTSDDAADHSSFYIADRMAGSPRGWQKMTFDDSAWPKARGTGPVLPFAATVLDPRLNRPVAFLSARSDSNQSQAAGERHLFRRKFFLNIGNHPDCGKAMEAPRIEPLVVSQPDKRHPVRLPTKTPTPLPAFTPTPTAAENPPPEAAVETVPKRLSLKSTPLPSLKPAALSTNPGLPSRIMMYELTPAPVSVPVSISPLTSSQPEQKAEAQTIVFDRPPANIYMSFADGPGVYRLEVMNPQGGHIRNLYERKIVGAKEDWASWDGQDDQGLVCPRGWYFVIYSKDGKVLKKILAGKTGSQ